MRASASDSIFLGPSPGSDGSRTAAFRVIQAEALERGDVAAVVASVDGTIRKIAKKYSKGLSKIDQEDLISAGKIGAIVAVDRFDPSRSTSYNTYATWWIRNYILLEVFHFWGQGRCPNTSNVTRRMFFQYAKECRRLEGQGIDPTPEVLADALGVPVSAVIDVTSAVAISEESAVDTFDTFDDADVLENLCVQDDLDEMRDALTELDDRERYVIEQRFFAERSLEQVGDDLDVCKERVRQLEEKALAKLRKVLENR